MWCAQKAKGMSFDCSTDNVGLHLKNIFAEGKLVKDSVTEKISATSSDGKNYLTQFYNLDAVISVGYRVNSVRATQFRQWATSVLREYAIRGYVLDRKRMENGTFLDEDYFEHLLAEIREIRLSERRFYQKLTDIYATAVDYNRNAPTTRLFFKMMQNKMMGIDVYPYNGDSIDDAIGLHVVHVLHGLASQTEAHGAQSVNFSSLSTAFTFHCHKKINFKDVKNFPRP